MDIQKRHFYRDVVPLLEEISEMIDDAEFDEDVDESDDEALTEQSILETFIANIHDALETAQENS